MSKNAVKKKKTFIDVEEVIPKVPDLDLDLYSLNIIEVGVRKLVSVLWKRNYATICSCAGHTNGLEPLPWVAVLIDEAEPQHLMRLFSVVGRFNLSLGKGGRLPKPSDTWVLLPQMTQSGLAVYVRPHSLNERRTQKEMKRLRELGNRLASFIKKEYDAGQRKDDIEVVL